MVSLNFDPDERDILVDTITEWLDGADETEKAMYSDASIDDPEAFLVVVDDHTTRTRKLLEIKKRLLA